MAKNLLKTGAIGAGAVLNGNITSESGGNDSTTARSVPSGVFGDVTDYSVTFTPSGTGNRVVRFVVQAVAQNDTAARGTALKLVLDGTDCLGSSLDGSVNYAVAAASPYSLMQVATKTVTAGSSHTIKAQFRTVGPSGTSQINYGRIEYAVIGS